MSIDKKSLKIKELSIGRMPGFRSGMAPFNDFSPNINIITGPNAAGKSTAARAIQKLIWQNDTDQTQIDGQAEIGDEPWTIRIDSSRHIVQRRGVDDEMSGIPASEGRNRYMLALHELIKDDGEDLAQRIIRESVGGYDPDSAGQELKYSERISTTGTGQYKNWYEAEKAVRERKESQKKIKEEEQKLSDLYRQRDESENARKKAAFYDLAVEAMKAERAFEELKDQKNEFPAVLDKANGGEFGRVEEIESEIAGAQEAFRAAESIIEECREQLKQLEIPEEGVSEIDLIELESRTEKIKVLEKEIADLEAEWRKLEKSKAEALRQIGEDVDPEAWEGLDLKDICDLDQFLQEAHRVAGEKRILEKEIEELEKESKPETPDGEQIRDGIKGLSLWLKEVPKGQKFPSWVINTIAVSAVLSALAGYMIPIVGLAGLVLILLIAIYGLMQLSKQGDNQKEDFLVESYESTGLNPPDVWNPESVSERLNSLTTALREAHWQERIKQKLENRRERLYDLAGRVGQVKQKENELKGRLSALPELPFEEPVSYTELAVFIKYVQQWQLVHAELLSLTEKLEQKKDQYQKEMESVSKLISKYSEDEVHDSAQAGALYKYLKKQEEQRLKNEEEIDRQQETINKQQDLIDRKKGDLEEIYKRFEIPVDEKDLLRQLLNRLDEFKKVVKEFELADREFSQKNRAMKEHSLFEQEHQRIEELTLDQAVETQLKLAEKAEGVHTIRDEIAKIEANVNAVKAGNSLEKELKEQDEAVAGLKQLYEDNLSSITGQLLVDTLKEQMREQNRPKVFKEANRLFNRITKGRYELEIDDKDKPDFRAYDTVEKIGRSLDELSSGTRIQLLMAVRLAFVETQESAVRLPILADELLANSDDVRAQAIIEALTEISRQGRQVFYFTAQGDEVAKWESYLSKNGVVDHKVFHLSGDKMEAGYKRSSEEWSGLDLMQNVPQPDSLSYEQYGEKLYVPGFNPLTDEPQELHLWYLLDDSAVLFNCLRQGIDRWGKLESYLHHGGILEGFGEELVSTLNEKAEILERFLMLFRQGRSTPIDRPVLEQSGAVTESFIDDVSALLNVLEGDPQKLLEALKNGDVSGFRRNKMDELEEYLLNNNYIDTQEPLSREEIQTRMQAYISNMDISTEEAQRLLKQVVK
jgi:DNA repair exonuclease SbcCD ATPase subunit